MRNTLALPFVALFVLVLSTAFSAAHAETITVLGQQIEATNVEYYVGSKTISNFNVSNPVTFHFPRGNAVIARDLVYLSKNGNPSLISSPMPQQLDWATVNGTHYLLECGPRATVGSPNSARIITFDENLEYKSGCALAQPSTFTTATGDALVASGDIDVTPQFGLLYAASVRQSSLHVGLNTVDLQDGKEIAFYPSGSPRFFTMKSGQVLTITDPNYGSIKFGQPTGLTAATTMSEQGTVLQGLVAQDLVHKETHAPIPLNSGVVFSDDGASIILVIYPQVTTIKAQGYDLRATRFAFAQEQKFMTVTIAEDFKFRNPETGEQIDVPPQSEVDLSPTMDIVGIRSPMPHPAP